MHVSSSWTRQPSLSKEWKNVRYIKVLLVNRVHLAAILATQNGSCFQLHAPTQQDDFSDTDLKRLSKPDKNGVTIMRAEDLFLTDTTTRNTDTNRITAAFTISVRLFVCCK